MNKFLHFVKSHIVAVSVLFIAFSAATLSGAGFLRAQSTAAEKTEALSDSALLADYRRVEVASVSDALEH